MSDDPDFEAANEAMMLAATAKQSAVPVKPKHEPPRLASMVPTYLPDIHRLLPQSPDAEMGVLASVLLDPANCFQFAADRGVCGAWFHLPAHRLIWETIDGMMQIGKAVDFVTLTVELHNSGRLEKAGGGSFVTSLFTFLPTPANMAHYVDDMAGKYRLREVIKTCTEIAARCYDEQDNAPGLCEELEKRVHAMRVLKGKGAVESTKALVIRAVAEIQAVYERRGTISGLSFGIPDLDKLTDGMHPEELIFLAARPSHGKTSLAMQFVEHIGIELRRPVAVCSFEMSAGQLVKRALCSRAKINMQRVRDGAMSERDFPALQLAAKQAAESNIHFREGSPMIGDVCSTLRRMHSEHGIELAVIDSMTPMKSREKERNRQIADITNALKQLAKELRIPILVIAHLKQTADRTTRPKPSDIGDGDSFSRDADVILTLVRDELIADDDETAEEASGRATLRIAKQRDGETGGQIPLTFLKEFTRFEPRAHEYDTEPKPQTTRKKPSNPNRFTN